MPEIPILPGLRGVVLHWTGGGYQANAVDRAAYHWIVEGDGRVVAGVAPEANMRRLAVGDRYAAHTGGWNSYRVGISCAGMKDYRSRSSVGNYPLRFVQVLEACKLAGMILVANGLDPRDPLMLCTHQEVWTLHGIKGTRNHQKTDIEYLPFAPALKPHDVGAYLRMLAYLYSRDWPRPSFTRPLPARREPPELKAAKS